MNKSVNRLKGVACLFVVLNHFHGDGMWGNIVYTLSNIGVPIFFLISGYYLYNEDDNKVIEKLPKKIIHVTNLIILQTLLNIYKYFFDIIIVNGNVTVREDVINYFRLTFSKNEMIKTLILSTGFLGKGQRFLISLLQCYIIFWILYKISFNKILGYNSFVLICASFCVHIILRPILINKGIFSVLNINLLDSMSVRNVWFDGFPFMLTGYIFSKKHFGLPQNLGLIFSALFAGISIVESFIVHRVVGLEQLNCVLYFGTILSSCFLIIYSVNNQSGITTKNKAINNIFYFFEKMGEQLSLWIYLLHPIIGEYILAILNKLPETASSIFDKVNWIIILIMTVVITYILVFIAKKMNLANIISNNKISLISLSIASICMLILLVPMTTKWKCIVEYTNNDDMMIEEIELQLKENISNYNDVMLSLQNLKGETESACTIPVPQFIGGSLTLNIGDLSSHVSVNYEADNNIKLINDSNGKYKMRIWVR